MIALFLVISATPVLELYQNGRFAELMEQLKNDASVEARLLRARAHYSAFAPSLGEPAKARELLLSMNEPGLLAETELALDPARALKLAWQANDHLIAALALARLGRRADALREAKLAERSADLRVWNALGRFYFAWPDKTEAARCVEAGRTQAAALIGRPRLTLAQLHDVADHDELYGDLLHANRHLGHARGFFAKNRTRFRDWPWQSAYTVRRRLEAERKLAAIDRELLGPPTKPKPPR